MNPKLILLPSALLALVSAAGGQGTAFTYQGRLNDGANPANGIYDLRFALYDASTNGSVAGGPLTNATTHVSNGLFAVTLDFGAGVFTGGARWLEIAVRPGASPGGFSVLNPRQPLTATPYALYALTPAGPQGTQGPKGDQGDVGATGPSGAQGPAGPSSAFALSGTNAYYNGGKVGIGTSTPANKLTLLTASNNYGFEHTDGGVRLGTYVGGATGGGWLGTLSNDKLSFFVNNGEPRITIDTNGRVGIGSITPQASLEVVGQDALRLVGSQPFLTLLDSNAGYARSRIQGVNGEFVLEPESYIAGQLDTGLILKNGTGFVGIGTLVPVAKLHAETSRADTAAVYGNATGAGGVGLYGQSAAGAAVHAEGNAVQARDKGGFVKAMAHINPFLPADQYVVRCFNSQLAGSATDAAPCGITVTKESEGRYWVDFGFRVFDRFISVTSYYPAMSGSVTPSSSIGPNKVLVTFTYIHGDSPDEYSDAQFFIFVY